MISVLLPTRGRPEGLKAVLESIQRTVAHPDNIEVIVLVDYDDPSDYSFKMPSFCQLTPWPRRDTKVSAYNAAYGLSHGEIIMPLADDTLITSQGWDAIIENEFEAYPDGILLLYGKDGIHDQTLSTHYIISRRMADALGYFSPPFFKGYYGDNFMMDLAIRIGRIKYNPEISVQHNAAHAGKAEKDATYLASEPYQQPDHDKYVDCFNELNQGAATLCKLKLPMDRPVKLGIGIPCDFPMVPIAFFQSMMILERPNFELLMNDNGHIDDLRNNLVMMAQKAGCTHLIMMDTDMVYHPRTITQLLSHKLPVVGALTFRRYPPFDPLLMSKPEGAKKYQITEGWTEGDLVEVDATGAGCIMFDMEVFAGMPYPWFQFRKNPDGSPVGEDIGFCQDLKRAGYKIFVDTSVPSAHLTTLAVDLSTHNLYKAAKKAQLRAQKGQE